MSIALAAVQSAVLTGGIDYARRWGVVEHWAGDAVPRLASISSANSMTAVNVPTTVAGLVYPTAEHYTAASSQYDSLADNAALSGADVDMWWAGWAYFDTIVLANKFPIVLSKWAASQQEIIVYINGDSQRFAVSVSGNGSANTACAATTFGAPSTATWYFVLVYHDAVNNLIGISINGGAFDTVSHSAGVFDGTAAFNIGNAPNITAPFWNGRIGPVTFGKPPTPIAALATEIRDRLYNSGAGRAYPWR